VADVRVGGAGHREAAVNIEDLCAAVFRASDDRTEEWLMGWFRDHSPGILSLWMSNQQRAAKAVLRAGGYTVACLPDGAKELHRNGKTLSRLEGMKWTVGWNARKPDTRYAYIF
jgi:hypothetical protein